MEVGITREKLINTEKERKYSGTCSRRDKNEQMERVFNTY